MEETKPIAVFDTDTPSMLTLSHPFHTDTASGATISVLPPIAMPAYQVQKKAVPYARKGLPIQKAIPFARKCSQTHGDALGT
jgi:hypothetical protein